MKKWELAKCLIDAKKCVDSVLYISEHAKELRYYGLKDIVDEKRNTFYINCCAILEHSIASKTTDKKTLCKNDPIIEILFRERDKNSAHKDENYLPQAFDQLSQIADQMRTQLHHIKELCSFYLPDNITLDFVAHDKVLFRAIHKILADDEEKILNIKHPLRNQTPVDSANNKSFNILNDTLDLRTIPEELRKEYAVLISDGINFQEGIQERQDAYIKINLLHNQNIWCSVNKDEYQKVEELTKLGCFNEFGVIQPLPTDPILLARINKLLEL